MFSLQFSKSMVFDVYSEFVNNFTLAMETAKKLAKQKQAFADFLKVTVGLDNMVFFKSRSCLFKKISQKRIRPSNHLLNITSQYYRLKYS